MKLKPSKKGLQAFKELQKEQEKLVVDAEEMVKTKPKTNKRGNKLPSDDYKPMFEPVRLLVRETRSRKDASLVKQYIEFKVMRYNDDEGLPFVWMTMYQESDFYTGYLKGKTVHFPLEMLYDVIENLNDTSEECDKLDIF